MFGSYYKHHSQMFQFHYTVRSKRPISSINAIIHIMIQYIQVVENAKVCNNARASVNATSLIVRDYAPNTLSTVTFFRRLRPTRYNSLLSFRVASGFRRFTSWNMRLSRCCRNLSSSPVKTLHAKEPPTLRVSIANSRAASQRSWVSKKGMGNRPMVSLRVCGASLMASLLPHRSWLHHTQCASFLHSQYWQHGPSQLCRKHWPSYSMGH